MRIRPCVIACLKENISRRNKHERLATDQLIITLRKRFKGAFIDTMRRWIKDIFIVNNNTIRLTRHEQVFLIRLYFERYFSPHWPT